MRKIIDFIIIANWNNIVLIKHVIINSSEKYKNTYVYLENYKEGNKSHMQFHHESGK